MKLIKSCMLLALCIGTTNFLFAQQEPEVAAKPVELKTTVLPEKTPAPAFGANQQKPAETKTAPQKNTDLATAKEEMPKPQVVPFREVINSTSSTDIIFPNTPLPKPVITHAAPEPATTPKQLPANKTEAAAKTPKN